MTQYSNITKRFLLATKSAEITELKQLSINCKVVGAVADMIHQLQKERGASNIFLASRSTLFAEQLDVQLEQSRQHEDTLRSLLKSLFLTHEGNKMRLLHNITLAMQGLDNLPQLREKVHNLAISSRDSTRAYCRLVTTMMAVIFEAADVANEPEITALLVSLFNFIQGKEFAGQERAWAAIGFAETHFDEGLCQKLVELQDIQAHSFEVFLKFCNTDEQQRWHQLENSHYCSELAQLRSLIQGLSDGRQIDATLSEAWFNVATNRIDQMRAIEEILTQHLNDLTHQKVEEAECQLAEHKTLLDSFDATKLSHASPLTLLFDERMPGLYGSVPDAQNEPSVDMQSAGTRSIYDLLVGQSENIKQMNQELEEARQALVDHKNISRAKAIMMEQLKVSEDQAHREIQKMAMDNNIKVSDLAVKLVHKFS